LGELDRKRRRIRTRFAIRTREPLSFYIFDP